MRGYKSGCAPMHRMHSQHGRHNRADYTTWRDCDKPYPQTSARDKLAALAVIAACTAFLCILEVMMPW